MHFTRPRDLVIAGLIGFGLGLLGLQAFYDSLPGLPLLAGATLFVLAVVEVIIAFSVRGRIRDGRVIAALPVARSVALAKASSVFGSLMLGAWGGALVYLLPKRDLLIAAASDSRSAIVGAVSAAVLIAAALWLEHCCRNPDTGEREEPPRSTG
jgi:hypothetical protein